MPSFWQKCLNIGALYKYRARHCFRRPPEFTISDVVLCLVTNDDFFVGTVAMLYSMKRNLLHYDQYTFRFFCDDIISPLSSKNREILRLICPNSEIIDKTNDVYRTAPCLHETHRPAYLTIELFRQLDFKKAFFIDVDMICLSDFSDAFFHPYEITGCGKLSRNFSGLKHWTKMNTGFFGISAPYLSESAYQELITIIQLRDDDRTDLLDQETIAALFSRYRAPVFYLDSRYNFRKWGCGGDGSEEFLCSQLEHIKIIHYSGYTVRPKPWEVQPILERNLQSHTAYRIWFDYAEQCLSEYPQLGFLFEDLIEAQLIKPPQSEKPRFSARDSS